MKRRRQPSLRPTINQKKEMTITRVNNRLEKKNKQTQTLPLNEN
jgi:hypothetical protein